MNRFNEFMAKRNFKRIFVVFVVVALILTVGAAVATGSVYREKIALALWYEKAGHALEHGGSSDIKQAVSDLASSADVKDVLLLDSENRILYSAKNSEFAEGNTFELKRADGGKFLTYGQNGDISFRFVKKDEFMLSSVFADDFSEFHDEYDEDNFYRSNFNSKKLYMISLLSKGRDGTKAYVISSPSAVSGGETALKAFACLAVLLFMLYWIIVALWVYQSALLSHLSAPIWGLVTLFANLGGVLVYAVYRRLSSICPSCGAVLPRSDVFCPLCGTKIAKTCKNCGHALSDGDKFCPKCGTENR